VNTENLNKGEHMEITSNSISLGTLLKQRRVMIPLTLRKLSAVSGVSSSHLGRVERGERFPSASILQKLAAPLGFEESELFSLAGYLSPPPSGVEEGKANYIVGQLDPYVKSILSEEPLDIQRTLIGILVILKNIARASKGE
jgi:transcriptional regulator with XRE-family HTH domain